MFSAVSTPDGCTKTVQAFFEKCCVQGTRGRKKQNPRFESGEMRKKETQNKVVDPSMNARTSQDADLAAVRVCLLVGLHPVICQR